MVHFAEINQAPPPYSMLQYIDRVATPKFVPRKCLSYLQTTLIMGGGGLVSEFIWGIVGKEFVRLTKWYQYIFSVPLKFGAYYITGQWGQFIIKILLNAFISLLGNFVCFFFHHKICVFIIFISFFNEVSNFRKRMLTNQKHELVVSNCQWNCM